MSKKTYPICPDCKEEMKISGTIRGGKPRHLFQCLNPRCAHHGTYDRGGRKIG